MLVRRPVALFHAALAVVVVAGVPLGSLLWGTGRLAFTMFARSSSYQLVLATIDRTGAKRSVAPTAVASTVRGSLGDMLAGAERMHHGPHAPLLRARLPEVAALACRARPEARRARAELLEKPSLDHEPVRSIAEVTCP
jgi:hypothetical protein